MLLSFFSILNWAVFSAVKEFILIFIKFISVISMQIDWISCMHSVWCVKVSKKAQVGTTRLTKTKHNETKRKQIMSKVWVYRGILMSHTNKINEIPADDSEYSENDYDSANDIASGKDIFYGP